MSRKDDKKLLETFLKPAGISINGTQPWDIHVHNDALYSRVLQQGALGLGEAYMDGWWDCKQLDVLFDRALRCDLDANIKIPFKTFIINLLAKAINLQTISRAKQNATHYDTSNELFQAMLDKRMIYSCGYYKNTDNLDDAQLAKLDLICKKIQLKPGMRLLDIGCGWGGLAKYAAERYGVSVVGLTLSKQQYHLATEHCRNLDIEIRLQDYRNLDTSESFDSIVSVGMFEHVGQRNYDQYMRTIHQLLTDKGLFLLHTIGVDKSASLANEWIRTYIFPNGMLPSPLQISQASESYFVLEDWQNFGPYYDQTLMDWHKNFINHWDELKNQFDERFFRMWSYYLLTCAGGFRARGMQLWQLVFSKGRREGVYIAPR